MNNIELKTDNLPKPDYLALKSTNRTIPVSLRVREDSYGFFVKLAEKYGASPSAIINELINSYADLYDNKKEESLMNGSTSSKISELSAYMREQLDLFKIMSDANLLAKVYAICKKYDQNSENAISYAKATLNDIEDHDKERTEYAIRIRNCPVCCTSNWHAESRGGIIEVPSRDWPLVAAYVMTFVVKRNELFGRDDYFVSELFMRNLEYTINRATSRNALINRLKMKYAASGITGISTRDLMKD